jgi:uncharacterized protein (TIGR03435 family)
VIHSILRILALSMLLGGALFAQDLTGTWQGTLSLPAPASRDLRIVIKVSKGDGAALKALMYSIDQGGQSFPASVTAQGATVKMAVGGIGATYEGKFDAEGMNITGSWTQGNPIPLNLRRATPETAWVIPDAPAPLKPMKADANPVFEVATIKPSKPDAQGKGFQVRARTFATINTTVNDMMTFAYGIHPKQVTGGPAWMETEHYDITAKPDGEGQPNDKQWKIMVQKLLADRFKLTFHRDKKELSVYAITVAKSGSKMTKNEGDPNGLPGLFFRGLGVLPARNATMADFAGLLQAVVLDRPVVDQTGLAGRFDFTLTWTPDEFQFAGLGGRAAPPADNVAAPPDLFTAMQQQLGLKLEATKAPTETLVVDKVEKPTEN